MPKKTSNTILRGDEGMWPFNMVPVARIKKLHRTPITPEWLLDVQRSSVRMNNGGSASFVSSDGLLATNHHVAASILHELSSEKIDYLKNGFLAKARKDELRAPQLEVNVLWEIEDVTTKVRDALRSMKTEKARSLKRRAVLAHIEKKSLEETGMRSDVVTLYNGGKYHLYRYKKYTDIRLVFAPESAIASYGGDVDNYEYPRYALDVTFFRVYENGKPLHTPHHFVWSTTAPALGEVLFVSGHPGSTNRLTTYDRLVYSRDIGLPKAMDYIRRKEILLQQFATRSPENARRAKDALHGIQNVRKRYEGQLASLQSPDFFKALHERELHIKKLVLKNPSLKRKVGDPWKSIRAATEYFHHNRDEYFFFEGGRAFSTEFFFIARTIIRLAAEDKKPNEKRLREFGDAKRASLLEDLYSPAPIYTDLETHQFIDGLRLFMETFGQHDTLLRSVLAGHSIEKIAQDMVSRTKLGNVAERKRLVKGGMRAVKASKDPFIQLALRVDERARSIRTRIETHVDEVIESAYRAIADALFALFGDSVYPDATFTLRLAYGALVPYTKEKVAEQKFTTIGGVFAHGASHHFTGDWELPASWKKKETMLKKDRSAFNFITTHDTHGGNSGSPVFNRQKEIVGLLFDGLMHTQGDTFMYMDNVPEHTICVHTQGIYSVLRYVYGATRLVKELEGK